MKVAVLSVFLAITASFAFAEGVVWPVGCSEERSEFKSVSCLEGRIEDLREIINVLQKSHIDQYDSVVRIIDRELIGPPKKLIPVPAVEYRTIYYYYYEKVVDTKECHFNTAIEPIDGYTLVGAEILGKKYQLDLTWKDFRKIKENRIRIGPSGASLVHDWWECRQPLQHCYDGTLKWCAYDSRGKGCYVNNEWLLWFQRQAERLSVEVNAENVCS